MGTSTNAIVWFGLNDETECEDELPESVMEKLRALPDDQRGGATVEDDELWEWQEVADRVLEKHGCVLVHHCHSDYAMFGLAIADSIVTAWRGQPQPLKERAINPDWIAQLMAAAEAIGWKVGDVGWWVASYWG